MTAPFIEIAGRKIGADFAPYVICELSGNHNGSLERALTMVDAAADTGCDAIKLQTYTADTITLDVDRPEFKIHGGLWDGRSLHELYQEAQTPYAWHAPIFERAKARGVTIFSSPFDETAVDLLAGLDAPAYKIASFEAVDLPLIRYAARQGKPLIISTGMANLAEMQTALDTALEAGAAGVLLLHCVSSYPASFEDANLRTIADRPRGSAARSACRTTRRARRPRWPPRPWEPARSRSTSPWRAATAAPTPPSAWSRPSSAPWSTTPRTPGKPWAGSITTCWAPNAATDSSAARCTSPPTSRPGKP
jgi:hypothetical protein